jgi:hypothetical protein
MLSIQYREKCVVPPFNLISVDSSPDYYTERENIRNWYNTFPINSMAKVKVLACQSAETFCTWVNPADGKTLPCFVHYQGKTMVWLSTTEKLNIEVLEIDKKPNDFFVDFKPRMATGLFVSDICAVKKCQACYPTCIGCCSGCSMKEKGFPGWNCKNDYSGDNC